MSRNGIKNSKKRMFISKIKMYKYLYVHEYTYDVDDEICIIHKWTKHYDYNTNLNTLNLMKYAENLFSIQLKSNFYNIAVFLAYFTLVYVEINFFLYR